MKINAEFFIKNLSNYKFHDSIILINGNEEGFIFGIQKIILQQLLINHKIEKVFFDFKYVKKNEFLESLNNQTFFNDFKVILVQNLSDDIFDCLKSIKLKNITILINSAGIKNNSKIKKYFDSHKKFYSIVCYKLSDNFKKNMVDDFINNNNIKLSEDAYWYLLHNIGNKYQLLENELEKLLNFSKEKISLKEITILLSDSGGVEFDDLFFDCINGSKRKIIINSQSTIKSLNDAYVLLRVIKDFSKKLTVTSEKKLETSLNDLVNDYLPKYLFKQKKNFEELINKTNLDKLVIINKLLQKTELYLRKNDNNYLMIIQRFLLNYSKIIK